MERLKSYFSRGGRDFEFLRKKYCVETTEVTESGPDSGDAAKPEVLLKVCVTIILFVGQ
jgi:hypothetical protein